MWQGHGISAPIWNYVFDRTVVHVEDAEATVDLQGLPEPRVEPEVVLHLGAAPQPRMASPDLLECIDWVAPGFEVVFSVFPGWQFAASDAAAAFGVHGALFVGKRVEVAPIKSRLLDELDRFKVVLESSDGVRREGSGGNVLGGPVHALKFLVEELARFPICEPLQPGELVTTGTLTEAMPLRPGQRWSAAFHGIDFHRLRLVVA
jgi:2-oxo-3-hexenedioate decarboxylase